MEVKSVGTFPVILLKLATPPLPPQTKLNLEQNGWNWVLFFGHNIARGRGGGGTTRWTQSRTKNVLRSRILRNYCLQGLFHTVPSSFVLHCSSKYYFRICSHFTEELLRRHENHTEWGFSSHIGYRKIPKIIPEAYIFQRPFLRGLFLEGLIFGGKFAFQNRLG